MKVCCGRLIACYSLNLFKLHKRRSKKETTTDQVDLRPLSGSYHLPADSCLVVRSATMIWSCCDQMPARAEDENHQGQQTDQERLGFLLHQTQFVVFLMGDTIRHGGPDEEGLRKYRQRRRWNVCPSKPDSRVMGSDALPLTRQYRLT